MESESFKTEKVISEICNKICKHIGALRDNYSDEEFEEIYKKYCKNCPTRKIRSVK